MSNGQFFTVNSDLVLEYRIVAERLGQLVVMVRKVDTNLSPLSDWDEEAISTDCPFTELAEFVVRATIKLTLCATQ